MLLWSASSVFNFGSGLGFDCCGGVDFDLVLFPVAILVCVLVLMLMLVLVLSSVSILV